MSTGEGILGLSKPWTVQVLGTGPGGRALVSVSALALTALVSEDSLLFLGLCFIVCNAGLIVPNHRVIVKIKIVDMRLAPCGPVYVLCHCWLLLNMRLKGRDDDLRWKGIVMGRMKVPRGQGFEQRVDTEQVET